MFGRRKEFEELVKRQFDEIGARLSSQEESMAHFFEENGAAREDVLSQISRHNANIDNLIDSIDERSRERAASKKQSMRFKEKEEKLLSLIDLYQELFFHLRRTLSGTENGSEWEEQFSSMEELLDEKRSVCGMTAIDKKDVPVDFSLHDVIEAKEVSDENRDGTVYEVIMPGSVYMGKVRKKAKVSAAKYGGRV